jgi:hypothetical protein
MRSIAAAILVVVCDAAWAGGTSVLGKVSAFSGERGHYTLRFEQTETTSELIPGCPTLDVEISYARVPSYSWLPWIETAHPTLQQTEVAAEYLRKANKEGRVVGFGFMGSGLIPTGAHCHFRSKGLQLFEDRVPSVLAFHNYV